MSTLIVVAVKDRAMDAFMRPFCVQHRNAAVRSFIDEVNRADSEMAKHPDDYDLYCVGSFKEDSGVLAGAVELELLIRGKDCVRSAQVHSLKGGLQS